MNLSFSSVDTLRTKNGHATVTSCCVANCTLVPNAVPTDDPHRPCQVRTMKANYKIEAGDVRVIRPLCYAREAFTKEFVRTNRLPVVNENCPACFEEPKERHRVKKARRNKQKGSG